MTTPRVDQAMPAGLGGVQCAGYARRRHTVTTQVYRVAHCRVYFCWDCLLHWGQEQIAGMPRSRRDRIRRRNVIRP